MRPYGSNVLIAFEPLQRQSAGGLWVDAVVHQRPEWMLARVLAVGPKHDTGLAAGDRITVREHYGTKVAETEDGWEVRMLKTHQVEALAKPQEGNNVQVRDVRERGT
jgi:co-chaperonin GroES (HSP10)